MNLPVGLLDTAGAGRGLASGLGGQLLTGSLSSGRLTGGLLCTGHGSKQGIINILKNTKKFTNEFRVGG